MLLLLAAVEFEDAGGGAEGDDAAEGGGLARRSQEEDGFGFDGFVREDGRDRDGEGAVCLIREAGEIAGIAEGGSGLDIEHR
jgi:hypothetical protein